MTLVTTKLPTSMNEMMKKCAKPNECNGKMPHGGMGSNANFWMSIIPVIIDILPTLLIQHENISNIIDLFHFFEYPFRKFIAKQMLWLFPIYHLDQ
jgi:hypothetical protein